MSYDIYIGNATPIADEDGFAWRVLSTSHPEAPIFRNDNMTRNENHRHPAYSVWNSIVRQAGLRELFFGGEGLMIQHPGITPITPTHVEQVEMARDQWKARYPNAIPRFGPWLDDEDNNLGAMEEDAILARLIWLAWWMRWTVENCEHPAIYNH